MLVLLLVVLQSSTQRLDNESIERTVSGVSELGEGGEVVCEASEC